MSVSEKLQKIFDAAMMEPEPTASASRMVEMPRNPNGSESASNQSTAADHDPDAYDPRGEMLARLSRMKEMLNRD